MRREMFFACCLLAVLPLCLLAVPSMRAENVKPFVIAQTVDENKLVTLGGNTRPEAKAKYDLGRVADNFLMAHLQLLLKRSAEQERELEELIEELHDPSSPAFHRWLTAKEFGERFGVSQPVKVKNLEVVTGEASPLPVTGYIMCLVASVPPINDQSSTATVR
jgi:pro-kumamolisin-like protein